MASSITHPETAAEPLKVGMGHWTYKGYQIVWYGLGYACTCLDYQHRTAMPAERDGEMNHRPCKHIQRVYDEQAGLPVEITAASTSAQPLQQPSEAPATVTEPGDAPHVAGEASSSADAALAIYSGRQVTFRSFGRERQGTVVRPHRQRDAWFVECDGEEVCVEHQSIVA